MQKYFDIWPRGLDLFGSKKLVKVLEWGLKQSELRFKMKVTLLVTRGGIPVLEGSNQGLESGLGEG